MAKSKRQSAGTTSQPERLNDQSLSSLTAKIEKNLSNPSKVDDSKKNKKRKHASDEPSTSHHQRKKQAHARENPTHDGKAAQTKPKGKKGGPLTRDDLLEEIRALGGDEEDLKLIGDVDSDQEETAGEAASISNDPVDGKLQNELAAFAAQLGLQQYHEEATASDLNGDDNVDEDNDQLDEDEPIAEFETANSFTNQLPAQEPTRKDAKDAPKKQFIFEPRSDWHGAELSQLPEPTSAEVDGSLGTVNALKTHALALLEADALAYTKSVLASSSRKFLSTIMSSGTLSDKVSALTLAIQESPLHNVKAFESLLGLAAKRSRAQAIGALGALVDLLGPGLVLPPNRRLRTFQTQPGLIGTLQRSPVRSWNSSQPLPGRLTEAHLVQWAYEDWLKTSYFRVIQLLEVWCNDEIEYSRTRSLDFVYGLLKDKPEQETNLLRLLVNKLGDKDRKIASRVSYLLLQLQNTHPGMKQVVIKGIEQEVLLRPGQTFRAKYHATNTLNQTILSNREVGTAEALLRIYFDIFVTLLNSSALGKASNEGQQEQVASGKESSVTTETADKLVTAVLTGINRAVPFVAAHDPILETQMDTLFRIAHSTNFNTSIQALILIQQISVSRQLESDRFYRTLYESLLDPRLANSSKQALYLNLLLRSLKADVDTRRIKAFAKRMLQILNMHQPAFACGLLYVVFQLRVQFPDLRALLEEPEDNDVEETAGSPVDQEQTKSVSRGTLYDGRKRNPEHSNAQNSCLWEIVPPLTHFHPSVSLLATSLFSDDKQMAKPDLESHSLIRFLDKFVYRSPKVAEAARGASIMQPVRNPDSGSIWLAKRTGSAAAAPINTPNFWNKKIEQVAAEDIFFHEYFKQAGKKNEAGKKEAKPLASVPDEPEDDAEEDEIWKALTASHPDGPIDSDESDLDMDGFDDSDDDSDGGVVFSDGSGAELSDGGEVNEDVEGFEDEEDDDDDSDEMGHGGEASELAALPEETKEASEKSKRAGRSSKRKLKDLPMFASADDYAELLAQEEDI
ncbi:CBF/Mak21 family protein [Colletotrichum higginsianum]|uniref:CBF/Mak21 family protein n=2 Tax=Colletotrichum higginsianum TaxID=80884 RepID=H1UX37_COLHI|nr:CBF/Mak21 family protein [Colletotrichum higginsianum IMI 349063]OBR15953.1 CBF/Mak21 family protein [Colletotrichum higginsianum IMI 349063]TID03823.1 Ribosome biogenesis protein NOC1 [Colletotrichum higginsianum]CCF32538.1 CBF/Mak21 family protein [Colletotrichum higginsianum]